MAATARAPSSSSDPLPEKLDQNKNKKKKTKTKKKTDVQTDSTPPQTPPKQLPLPPSTPKRTKSPGVRIVGKRIYDSKNGKTCHQCRQKTMDFSVSCTNIRDRNRQCTFHFCHSCLKNRYGEKAEEVAALGDWKCPKCRDICNCSFCMKKRGCGPTGMLAHVVKKNGFSSVSNFLNVNGSKMVNMEKGDTSKKRNASDQEMQLDSTRKRRKRNAADEKSQDEETTNGEESRDTVEIQLPQGTELLEVADIDVASGDAGHVLQLLEFCGTFGEVLDLKKGEPENLLRALTCRISSRTHDTQIAKFHKKLLSVIEEDWGKKFSGKSWVDSLRNFISEREYPSEGWFLDCKNMQPDGYKELSFSRKLRLLNFLCDEALGAIKLRSYIDEENLEDKKRAKQNLISKRKKEKNMKNKLQAEVAKAILSRKGVPLSIAEHEDLVSKIKAEAAETVAKTLEASEEQQLSNVLRAEPVFSDTKGHRFWKLRSYSDLTGILLQDAGYGDEMNFDEKWFSYNTEEKVLVDKYISSSRNVR